MKKKKKLSKTYDPVCTYIYPKSKKGTTPPKKLKSRTKAKPKLRKSELLPINIDEFEKNKMTKKRPLAENTWYEPYDWLISHVPKSLLKGLQAIPKKKS